MAPQNLNDFVEKFKKICEKGWIQTHREGTTGVGKTLEDLLEIKENNIDGPDFANYELKAMRINANSLLTLFTKALEPRGINKKILSTYGYSSDTYQNDNKVLHTTLYANRYTSINNSNKKLKISCNINKISIVDENNIEAAYWTKEYLEKAFLKKYKYRLIHVYAYSKFNENNKEEFLYNAAFEMYNFNFETFKKLLENGKIAIDIRIGQYSTGKIHDHGTGFRISENDIPKLFTTINQIV